jgi:hypothetical protein
LSIGSKITIQSYQIDKIKENIIFIQTKAIENMVVTTLKKSFILENKNIMALFMILDV